MGWEMNESIMMKSLGALPASHPLHVSHRSMKVQFTEIGDEARRTAETKNVFSYSDLGIRSTLPP